MALCEYIFNGIKFTEWSLKMNWTRIDWSRNIQKETAFLLFLFFIFTLVTGSYLYEIYYNSSRVNHLEVFESVLLNMNNTYDYNYIIIEETREYDIEFAGLVVNPDKIIGSFRDYNLDVYKISDNLFIKNPLEGDWEIVNEIDLDELKSFVQSPSYILEQVIMEWEKPFQAARHAAGEEEYYLIIYTLESLEKERFILDYYPHLSSYGTTLLTCNVWITAEEPFLHKVEFIISLTSPEGREEVIRREMLINQDIPEEETPLPVREQI